MRISDWSPNEENVLVLSDTDFDRVFSKLESGVSGVGFIGYAHLPSRKVLVRLSASNNDKYLFLQTFMHEALHVWCQRNKIEDDKYSYYVNEAFIEYLSLRALGAMDMSLEELPQELADGVSNLRYIHETLENMGRGACEWLFDVCQGGNQDFLREKMNAFYGDGPLENKKMGKMFYGTDFYSRFKEYAALIYLVGVQPNLQSLQLLSFFHMMNRWVTSKKIINKVY
ncbi:hypothetical protein CSB37_00090 [bacterium DOLZORAL124_38_8]|nr:MAG: hypothetical protein CSB37_00090 [bacterium DOLZORAL124_38_8]